MGTQRQSDPGAGELTALFCGEAAGLAGAVRGILGPQGDIQEVLQDAFLRAWRVWKRDGPPRDAKAWVFVTVLNTARDQRRQKRRHPSMTSITGESAMELPTTQPPPEANLAAKETLTALRSAIHQLDDEDKDVFLLRVSGDLTFAATAKALHIPVGTAKTRMRRALAQLRTHLHAREAIRKTGRNEQ